MRQQLNTNMKRDIKTALLSASVKDQALIDLATALIDQGCTAIYGSRGTVEYLGSANIKAIDVATIVGEPILGHRVVTLSREVHAALLALHTDKDLAELKKIGLPPFDFVYVDPYPLEQEIKRPGSTLASVLDKMDIGGPTMLSAGSKGQRVIVPTPDDIPMVIDWLRKGTPDYDAFVESQAAKADFTVSKYRMLSAEYRSQGKYVGLFGTLSLICKYGENVWQKFAALFTFGTNDPLAISRFKVIAGDRPEL
jgi:phosphoribosylaminoimidazolecarboxamide formyltransferase/IMP cyclohydrolase